MLTIKERHDTKKLGSSVVQELKINQRRILIDSLEVGIPAPEQMIALGERQLPNGIKVGQLLNSKTLNYKKFTPHRDGLFCERIFGPVQSFVCACGKRKESIQSKSKHKDIVKANLLPQLKGVNMFETRTQNKSLLALTKTKSWYAKRSFASPSGGDGGKKALTTILTERPFCPKCQVEYISKSVRRHRLGYIKLFAPVTHIWYLKGRPSYLSLFLGKRKKAVTSLTYCNAYLVEQACFDLKAENLLKDTDKSVSALVRNKNVKICGDYNSDEWNQTNNKSKDSRDFLRQDIVIEKKAYLDLSLLSNKQIKNFDLPQLTRTRTTTKKSIFSPVKQKNKNIQTQNNSYKRPSINIKNNYKNRLHETQKDFNNQNSFTGSYSKLFYNLLIQLLPKKVITTIKTDNLSVPGSLLRFNSLEFKSSTDKVGYPFVTTTSNFVKQMYVKQSFAKGDHIYFNKLINLNDNSLKQGVHYSNLRIKRVRYKVNTKLEAIKYFVDTAYKFNNPLATKTKLCTRTHTKTLLYKSFALQVRFGKHLQNFDSTSSWSPSPFPLPRRSLGTQSGALHPLAPPSGGRGQVRRGRVPESLANANDNKTKRDGITFPHSSYIRAQTLPFLPSLICSFHLRDSLISFLQSSPFKEEIPISMYCQISRRYPLRDVHKFLSELRSTNTPNQTERLTNESIGTFLGHLNKKNSHSKGVSQRRQKTRNYIDKDISTRNYTRKKFSKLKSLGFTKTETDLKNRAQLCLPYVQNSEWLPKRSLGKHNKVLIQFVLLPMCLHFVTNSTLIQKRLVNFLRLNKKDIAKELLFDSKLFIDQILSFRWGGTAFSRPMKLLERETKMSLRGMLLYTFFDSTKFKLFGFSLSFYRRSFQQNKMYQRRLHMKWVNSKLFKLTPPKVQGIQLRIANTQVHQTIARSCYVQNKLLIQNKVDLQNKPGRRNQQSKFGSCFVLNKTDNLLYKTKNKKPNKLQLGSTNQITFCIPSSPPTLALTKTLFWLGQGYAKRSFAYQNKVLVRARGDEVLVNTHGFALPKRSLSHVKLSSATAPTDQRLKNVAYRDEVLVSTCKSYSDLHTLFFRERIYTYQTRLLHLVFDVLPQNVFPTQLLQSIQSFCIPWYRKDLLGVFELGYIYLLRKYKQQEQEQSVCVKSQTPAARFFYQDDILAKLRKKFMLRKDVVNSSSNSVLLPKQNRMNMQKDTKQSTTTAASLGPETILKWHTNGAKEILLYTGGGALNSLLKCFNTSVFCQFLLDELQILRKYYKNQIFVVQSSACVPKQSFGITKFCVPRLRLGKHGECNKNKTVVQHNFNSFKRNELEGTKVRSILPFQEQTFTRATVGIKQDLGMAKPRYHSNISTEYHLYSDEPNERSKYVVNEKNANLFCRRIYRTTRRLKVVQLLMRSKRQPEWMTISILPVLPPDLRPVLQMGDNLIVASDLNTLYQRVIYRNNRHYKGRFLDFHFVSSIHRLVQDAVDRLIENGKGTSTPFLTPGGRPLKSLSDILKGKRGRFRFNLLGKRVDFSGRSVIVVDPNLKIHECGLPKEMALELYKYLLIRQLLLQKLASSIVNAKKIIKERKPFIWDLLRQIIYYHPVLLNRAPTLHRLGIQAFQPKLILGNAILLHPLVCAGFNADFDGDQMGVHLPLSPQARAEAWDLLWSRNNLLSPATGLPILLPSQDMVLGFYYMTSLLPYGTTNRSHVINLLESQNKNFVMLTKTKSWYAKLRSPCPPFFPSPLVPPSSPLRGGGAQSGAKHARTHALKSIITNSSNSLVPIFLDISQVIYAYQKKQVDIHTPIWLKWGGKSENGEKSQIPLELRLNTFGDQTQIYSTHQARNKVITKPISIKTNKCQNKVQGFASTTQSVKMSFLSFHIRTTVGRVLVNNLISTNHSLKTFIKL